MLLETLESRQLLSASLNAAGLLTVQGTNNADSINVSVANGKVKLVDNGVTTLYNAASVKKIAVYAKNGADSVVISTTVALPTYIDTGLGHPSGGAGDYVQGGNGPDTVDVRGNFASVNTQGGNDIINNFGGFNSIQGNTGNDYIAVKFGGPSDSTYNGGNGNDTLDYSAATIGLVIQNGQSGKYFSNTGIPPTIDGSNADSTSQFENFLGGKGNDFIIGTASSNLLKGNGGDDNIRGMGGNDLIYGGSGKDALFGDDGDDQLYANDGEKDFLSGGIGLDKASKDALDVLNSVEGTI